MNFGKNLYKNSLKIRWYFDHQFTVTNDFSDATLEILEFIKKYIDKTLVFDKKNTVEVKQWLNKTSWRLCSR